MFINITYNFVYVFVLCFNLIAHDMLGYFCSYIKYKLKQRVFFKTFGRCLHKLSLIKITYYITLTYIITFHYLFISHNKPLIPTFDSYRNRTGFRDFIKCGVHLCFKQSIVTLAHRVGYRLKFVFQKFFCRVFVIRRNIRKKHFIF